MTNGKRKKKSLPSLLLEPTVEEEQRILQREQLQQQLEEEEKEYQSLSSAGNRSTEKKGDSVVVCKSFPYADQMSASINQKATGGGGGSGAIRNVIMTTKNGSSIRCQNLLSRRENNKHLTNLLALLFGLLLIVCTTTTRQNSAHAEPSPETTLRDKINATTLKPLPTATTLTSNINGSLLNLTTLAIATTNSDGLTTTTTTASDSDGTSVTIGGEPLVEGTETSGTDAAPASTITFSEEVSSSLATPTSGPTVNSTVATTASGPIEGDGNADDRDQGESDAGSGNDERPSKLNSGFIIETAGEAADQLLANLKPPTEVVGSDEDASLSADADSEVPESTGSESGPLERRDIGGDESKQQRKQTTPMPVKTTTTTTSIHPELKLALDSYTKWKSVGDDLIELFSRKMLPVVMEHGYDIDSVTITGLLQVFNGIRGLKPWALKLLDASAKITPGLLVGTQSDFGDFDECLSVRVDDPAGLVIRDDPRAPVELDELTGLPTTTLVGRYCLADIEFPKPPREKLPERNQELQTDNAPIELRRPLLNFSDSAAFKDTIFVETGNFFHMLYVDPLRFGVCLTNKIDPDSFAKVFNKLLEEFKVSINFRGRCVTKYDPQPWTIQQTVSGWIILVACSLVTLCTLLEVLHTKLNKFPLPNSCSKGKLRLQSSLQRPQASAGLISNKFLMEHPPPSPVSLAHSLNQHHRHRLSAASANCSNSTTSGLSYSSSESSPSIERRSSSSTSGAGSAVHLISESSSLNNATGGVAMGSKRPYGLAHFTTSTTAASARVASTLDINGEINLLCLHGIRVITMTWMIVNHTYMFGGFFVLWAYRRLIDISEWPKSISFQLVLNGWLTVETYFFLGATILVLSVMPAMKSRKFTYVTYVLHRLIRLLPAYTGLICLNFLWPLISSGPVWLVKGRSFIQEPCENYLWANYLFISNWIWPEKQCMVHTWYLSADFQLYLVAPVIVFLLYKRPVFGHSLNIIVALVASIVSGLVIYANKLMPTTLINKLEFDSIKQQLSYSYFATYQHVGPYCLGIFTGYLLHKRPHVHLPKHLTWALWILLPPLSLTTLFLTYLWNGAYSEPSLINPSPIVSALYVAIHRTIWTSLVAWIVFACATGRAKLLSNFLSHSMFIPLSRLSFSIYLVHLPVIMYRALNLRHTIEWTDSNILWEACGNFIVSLIVAYFVNVTFESPFINLEQALFGSRHKAATGNRKIRRSSNSSSNNLDELNSNYLQQNQKLRLQLGEGSNANSSKTTSENNLDDKASENLATSIQSSQSSSLDDKRDNDGGGDLVMVGSQTSIIKRRTFRKQLQQEASTYGVGALEPASMSHYGDIEDHNDDDDSDNLTITQDSVAPVITSSVLSSSNGPDRSKIRRNKLQQVAPTFGEKQRKLSASKLDPTSSSSSSTIYQMAPMEYQQYANKRQVPLAMFQHQQQQHQAYGNGGNPARFSQYATLDPSSNSLFNRGLSSRASGGLEYHHGGVGGSISRNGGGQLPPNGTNPRFRPTNLGGTTAAAAAHPPGLVGLRRQGRYNTLSVTGSREWHRQMNSLAAGDDRHNWLRQVRDLAPSVGGSPNWLVGHSGVGGGSLLPRIDSSTLRSGHPMRGSSYHRPDFSNTRASSIVEEEREDIIRI